MKTRANQQTGTIYNLINNARAVAIYGYITMKIITISKIGYNAPSQANWTYSIFKIDLIDTSKSYNHCVLAKANFGGESTLKKLFPQIIETQSVYTKTGTPKITGISRMHDVKNDTLHQILKDFMVK